MSVVARGGLSKFILLRKPNQTRRESIKQATLFTDNSIYMDCLFQVNVALYGKKRMSVRTRPHCDPG